MTRSARRPKEHARSWQSSEVEGLELLEADLTHHTFPRHTHDGYMISVIERGAQALTHRGATQAAPAGHIVVVPPGEAHAGRAATDQGWRYRVFTVPERVVARTSARCAEPPRFRSTILDDRPLAATLLAAHRAFDRDASALERQSRLLLGLHALVDRHAVTGSPPAAPWRADPRVRRAREFMDAHFTENVTLERLAHVVGLSPLHLVRLFTRDTGLPPHTYLIQLRIRRAQHLLAAGELAGRVAFRTGFADQSHFTRYFKRLVGVSPGRYRRDHGHPAR